MEYFTHLPDFQVIICKECQHAVLPSHIDTHFTAKPQHDFEKKERQRIADAVADINGLIGNEETLRRCKFPFPPSTSKPIPALAEPRNDGMQCELETAGQVCQYICCTTYGIRKHCWEEHGWKSKKKGGRPKKHCKTSQEVPWRTGVHCQRFFIQGHKSGYFEVQRPEASPESSQPGIASRTDQFKAAKRELEEALRKAEAEERRVIKEAEEAREPNPWLRRVGWAAHLAGLDRAELREWIEMPDEEEPDLEILCKAFDWMIQDAQYVTVQEVVSQAALFEANRKDANVEPRQPFDSWMDITTVKSYTHVWKQLLCYVFRAEDEEVRKRPAYKLRGQQQIAKQEVRDIIREFQEWKQDQPINEADEDDESDEEIEFMGRIQREVLRLCIELLNHPLQDNEYQNVIISGLAIMGIRDDDGWLDADDYTPKYSAIIKLARLMVVQEGYERRQEAIRLLQERELTAEEAKEAARSYYHFVRQLTHQFMTMNHSGRDPSPMDWIFKARSYGFKIRYTTTAEGCIQWVGDTVLYQQVRFNMSQVQSMVHGLVEEARDVLYSKLMRVDMDAERQVDPQQVPPIYWDRMVDNPSESRVGWSFLDDERNKFDVDGEWWLYERMFQEQRLRKQFINENADSLSGPMKEEVEAYEQEIERFQELLLILMHISGGQAGRAPELLGIRWKNTEQGGVRNIFIEDGLVAFVTAYHKGYRSSGNIKIIHRYLPREIGELLVYYLWLIRPFHEKLQFQVDGKPSSSPFLWGNGKKIEHRRWTGPKRYRKGQEEEVEPIRWTSERMRHVMQEASMRWIGEKLHISAWRQISIAMSRRYCREHPFPREDTGQDSDGSEEDSLEDSPWDLQSGHSSHIAGMIYARELMEGGNAVISRREQFRQVSMVWHRFLKFGSAHDSSGAGCKRKREVEDDIEEVQRARWKRLREVDIKEELKHMLGEQAKFRGLQEPALEAIMRNESPILVVMGTGAGKSLLFQLPAHSQKSGTTVVVVPLKSLEKSLHERCQKAGISCIRWDAQKSDRMAQIVLVQPESAVGTKFAQYLNRLEGLGQLVRIVFDETHTVLDSRPDFRPKMREAGAAMVKRRVQMVYLTATLCPDEEEEFKQIMKVQIPPTQIFRAPTSRPNIAYSVVEHPAETEEITFVQELVAQKLQQYPAPAKIIIYSSSIDSIEEIGAKLGCHVYHANVGSPEVKSRIQEQWERGDGRVIVASNAFGLGIDRPDVRAVIHVGPIYQTRNYGQESGRAGRDGQPSEAIIIVGEGKQEALQTHHARLRRQPMVHRAVITEADKKRADQEKVDRFISGAQCRRIDLDREMDGRVDRLRCEDGEERCDICRKSDAMMEEAEALREAYQAEQNKRYRSEQTFDSGIDIPSSQSVVDSSSPRVIQPANPGATQPNSSGVIQSAIPGAQPSSPPAIQSSSPPIDQPSSPPIIQSRSPGASQPSSPPINQSNGPPVDPPSSPSLPCLSRVIHKPSEKAAEERDFQRQQMQRKGAQAYAQIQAQADSRAVWELEQQLREWVGRCPVCFIRGFSESKHSIIDCVEEGAAEVRKDWFEMKGKMRDGRIFAAYSCCYDCHVPQAICSKWAHENGRWRYLPNGICQFDQIIMPAVISGINEGKDQTCNMIRDQIQRDGVKFGDWDKEGITVEEWEEMYRWFGQKEKWGDVEISRLVGMFYNIVKRL
jgi:RecQ family ATP-dependent DNA helicase